MGLIEGVAGAFACFLKLWSAVPGFIAARLLGFGVKEEKALVKHAVVILPSLSGSALSLPMRRYLLVLMPFTLTWTSETFILLLSKVTGNIGLCHENE